MFRLAGYVCLLISLPCGLSAAGINGRVYDPSGGVVPGASVTLVAADGANQTATAAEDGKYAFQAAPGVYRLEVRSPGFALFSTGLKVAGDVVVPLFLRLGTVTENLEVSAAAPAGVTPQAGVPARVRVGGHVTPVRMIHMSRPEYPTAAKDRGVHGAVSFRAVILKDGSLGNLTVASDVDALLVEAAAATVRQWRYEPATLNGQPVETETVITINYALR